MNGRTTVLVAALGLALALPAFADDHGPRRSAPQLPAYAQECAGCHMAYPPGLLPAASWQRLMGGLSKHFGTDASLDAADAQPIAAWLVANAGTDRKLRRDTAPPPDDRISRAGWFVREHREVTAAVWQR
jgi:hypothetical protein